MVGFVVRAASGPINMAFLVEWALGQLEDGPINLQVGAARLDLSSGEAVIILEESVISVAGTSSAEVLLPRTEIDVSLVSLLTGNVEVTGVRLDRPSADLFIGGRSAPLPKLQSQVVAIDKFSILLAEELRRRNLQSVTVTNGAVTISSATGEFNADGIDAVFEVLDEVSFQIESSLSGEQGRWSWNMRRKVSPETGERSISVEMDGVAIGDLLPSNVDLPLDKGRGTPLFANAEAVLTPAGSFKEAELRLRTGRIRVHLTDADVNLDEVFISLKVLRDEPEILIGRSYFVRGQTRAVFGGVVNPPAFSGAPWTYSLGSREVVVAPSDVNAPPTIFIDAYVDGRIDMNQKTLFIDAARLLGLSADINVAGSLYFGDNGPWLALSLVAPRLTAAQVLQLWPVPVVAKTRHWLVEHIKAGAVENLRLDLGLGPASFDGNPDNRGWVGDAVTASFDINDAALATLDSLPIASNLSGTGRIENETLIVEAKDGEFRMQDGKIIHVDEVTYKTLNLALRPERSHDLSLVIDGAAADLGVLVNAEPFRALERLKLVPSDLTGAGKLKVEAAFPVQDDISFDDVVWRAELETKGFSSSREIGDQIISEADLVVVANKESVTVQGAGKLNGLQAQIDLESPMDGVEGHSRQGIVLDATVDALAEQGLDLSQFLSGPLQIELSEVDGTKVYRLNLTRTTINLDPVGWTKASGVKAEARFRMLESDSGRTIHNFALLSDGVEIRGNAKLSNDGELEFADFSQFNLRPNDEVEVSIRHDARRGYDVDVRGQRLDGRGILKRFKSAGTGEASNASSGADSNEPLRVNVQLRNVTGFGGVLASQLDGTISLLGDTLQSMNLSGQTSQRNPFKFDLKPSERGKRLSLNVQNVGELLKFADLFARMRGGFAFGQVDMPAERQWQGNVVIKDFSITEDPAIQALAKSRQRNSAYRRGEPDSAMSTVARSGEASFNRMGIEFNRNGDILYLTRGVLAGAIIGGTVEGTANLSSKQLDMTGTFVPAYTINNFLSKVPILGLALGGGSGDGGLFGVTYKMTGSFEDPKFTINPVSAIAPGIFRKIFEFQ
ncbi:AsmA-like C-terminal domain-containing protein [Pseudovibrio sp. SPO723]|uniref:AsmA-like C-terminal domain-containing protein n=1 Tax=Nesiotobacter zosterae TaxID=392721 RepID=UPI0029C13DB5|nr:AsmA-like C-terminal domain-containing protein [Pseudovibrio sp. SPO723]MDX5592686.1 AsmA-like C-terminal domain-containing protein [Pseudovibrio sp. SPO723]